MLQGHAPELREIAGLHARLVREIGEQSAALIADLIEPIAGHQDTAGKAGKQRQRSDLLVGEMVKALAQQDAVRIGLPEDALPPASASSSTQE